MGAAQPVELPCKRKMTICPLFGGLGNGQEAISEVTAQGVPILAVDS